MVLQYEEAHMFISAKYNQNQQQQKLECYTLTEIESDLFLINIFTSINSVYILHSVLCFRLD